MQRSLVEHMLRHPRLWATGALLAPLAATLVAWQAAERCRAAVLVALAPAVTLGGGLAISGLLAAIGWLWLTRRKAARRLAAKISAELRATVLELRQTRHNLEARVQRRMDDLSLTNEVLQEEMSRRLQIETQLESKLRQLHQVNVELNDFAYIASHDLRAPLRAIGSLAHWIAEDHRDVLSQDGRDNLDTLISRVRRMDALITGILQYSRIGRTVPTLETLPSERIAREAIDSLGPPEGIVVRVHAPLPEVYYDRSHLQQLFQNLIGNAIKHLGKPSGTIDVGCTETEPCWEFSVRDDGVGIERKHFERIFKIFQTLKPRDQLEASGIGLSIVKAIAEKHGGQARVESTVGQGSTFFFTILKPSGSPEDGSAAPLCAATDNPLQGNIPAEVT